LAINVPVDAQALLAAQTLEQPVLLRCAAIAQKIGFRRNKATTNKARKTRNLAAAQRIPATEHLVALPPGLFVEN
jgi:hypothetical protein